MLFLSGLIDRLTARAREGLSETIHGLVLYALAGVAALVVVMFLTLAVFWVLENYFTPAAAALLIAAIYAVISAGLLAWAMSERAATAPTEAGPALDAPEPPAGDTVQRMSGDLNNAGQTLATAGYRVEGLAALALSNIARQLSPLQLLSLVFVGSFFFGRRLVASR